MSVFYLAVLFNTCVVLFVAFVLPESLTSEARLALGQAFTAKKSALAEREAAERAWEEEIDDVSGTSGVGASGYSRISNFTTRSTRGKRRFQGRMKRFRRRIFGFLAPLRLFIPKDKLVEQGGRTEMRKDYNLLLLVSAMFCSTSTMVSLAERSLLDMVIYVPFEKGNTPDKRTVLDIPLRMDLCRS
jgi:hypothetical protein